MVRKLASIGLIWLSLAHVFAQVDIISLYTNQHIYTTYDQVQFILQLNETLDPNTNGVGYFEILDAESNPIAQSIFPFKNEIIEGSIRLPVSISTGMYYLRAYTNRSNFYVRPLWIINPSDLPALSSADKPLDFLESRIDLERSSYSTREEVKVTCDFAGMDVSGCVITVIPLLNSCPNLKIFQRDLRKNNKFGRGLILSGIASPASLSSISINSIEQEPKYWSTRVGDEGEFFQPLPLFDSQKTLLLRSNGENKLQEINIDSWYDTQKIIFKPDTFLAIDSIKLFDFFQAAEIYNAFKDLRQNESVKSFELSQFPFYGKAEHKYFLREYVAMSLEEFLFEIVKEIKVVKTNKSKQLRVEDPVKRGPFIDEPLILLDGAVVSDHEKILGLNSGLFESIRVVDRPYLIDGKLWSGIIHFTSHEYAGLGLTDTEINKTISISGVNGFTKPKTIGYESQKLVRQRVPDFRQNLFWNHVDLTDGEAANISFYTSDALGVFKIKFMGTDNLTGKPFEFWKKFEVAILNE